MQQVAILGSGMVGQTLAAGFIKYGYSVKLGTSAPDKLAGWVAGAGKGVSIESMENALKNADIVVLAVKGSAAVEVASKYASLLTNKIVIDTTNPIAAQPPEQGVLAFFTDANSSLLEKLQQAVPSASFVKAFSCIGSAGMVNPQFKDGKPSMFICGNDENAKQTVTSIVNLFGHDVEDMGGAASARAIEPLCMLWCIPGFLKNDWNHAFKLLR